MAGSTRVSSSESARPQCRPRSSASSTAVCTTRSREMRRTTSSWGRGEPAQAALAPTSCEVADQRLVDLGALAGDGEDGLEPGLGLLDEPGLLAHRPTRCLGEDGGEDVERPPGHLLGLAVEGVEQGLGVGAVGLEGVEEVARAVVGVAGQEGLQVDERERRTVRALTRRLEVPRRRQRRHRLDGQLQQRGCLRQRHLRPAAASGSGIVSTYFDGGRWAPTRRTPELRPSDGAHPNQAGRHAACDRRRERSPGPGPRRAACAGGPTPRSGRWGAGPRARRRTPPPPAPPRWPCRPRPGRRRSPPRGPGGG